MSAKRDRAEERPPAPWGKFPLAELTILAGIILLIVGFIGGSPTALGLGIALGALGGLEVSIREHFAGFKSHTTVLSLAVAIAAAAVAFFAGGPRWLIVAIGVPLFVFAFFLLRNAFARRSGGYTMR